MYDDKIILFQPLQILPVQFAHLPHGLDCDGLVVGTIYFLHEDDDMVDKLQSPLNKLIITAIYSITRHLVVVLHQLH